MNLYKTNMPQVYMAKTSETNGIVYQKEARWWFEYYQEGTLVQEELQLKF